MQLCEPSLPFPPQTPPRPPWAASWSAGRLSALTEFTENLLCARHRGHRDKEGVFLALRFLYNICEVGASGRFPVLGWLCGRTEETEWSGKGAAGLLLGGWARGSLVPRYSVALPHCLDTAGLKCSFTNESPWKIGLLRTILTFPRQGPLSPVRRITERVLYS